MEALGFQLTGFEIAVFSAAAGVAVATLSLLVNMAIEAIKRITGHITKPGVRRCGACMDPAETGSSLCFKHAQLSAMVQRRLADM